MAPNWRKLGFALVGLVFGSVCLWFAGRNVDFHEAKRILASSDWRWIILGIAIFGADLFLRTVRWQVLLSHRQPVDYVCIARGLLVGYAVNILLPARLGEIFRAEFTARIAHIARSVTVASIFIERLTDLFAVLILFALGLALTGIESPAMDRVVFVGVAGLLMGLFLIYLVIFRAAHKGIRPLIAGGISKIFPKPIASRALGILGDFTRFIEVVRTPRFALVLALTVPIWTLEALSVFSICRAVGLDLNPQPLMVLLGGASLSTLFPSAPGFVGSYQFGYVMVLRNFSVPDTLSLVAATAVQIYLMGVYSVVGLLVWIAAPLLFLARSRSSALLSSDD
jgi:glycosyltransferase 2 family protein